MNDLNNVGALINCLIIYKENNLLETIILASSKKWLNFGKFSLNITTNSWFSHVAFTNWSKADFLLPYFKELVIKVNISYLFCDPHGFEKRCLRRATLRLRAKLYCLRQAI